MIKQRLIKVMAGAVALGALLFAAPAVTQAATIVTSVSVTIGAFTWCDTTSACVANGGIGGKIWDLGGGKDLALGSLVLTQAQLSRTYDFDTSEQQAGIPVITINGSLVYTDAGGVLNTHGSDTETSTFQEATDWTSLGSVGGISLWVGYADNAHGGTAAAGPQQCSDANHTCLPEDPWEGTATYFLGNRVSGGCVEPGTTTINPDRSCYDAGALRLELTPTRAPEPSVLLTLGTGLMAIALFSRRALKNRA